MPVNCTRSAALLVVQTRHKFASSLPLLLTPQAVTGRHSKSTRQQSIRCCHYQTRLWNSTTTAEQSGRFLVRGRHHKQYTTMPPVDVSQAQPIVFSGPSGTGKSTLLTKLFAAHPDLFGFSVSHTTRKPRGAEEDGVHYHFVSREEFERMIGDGEFEEHAQFGGNYYGSSKAAVQAVAEGRGKTIDGQPATGKRICVFDIEMEGVKQLKKSRLQPRICFIQPPDVETLEKRLRGRGTDSEEAIGRRLAQAKNEIEYCRTEGKEDKVVINDDLDRAFQDLDEWVMQGLASSS